MRVNLKEFYPFYEHDTYTEAPDEVVEQLHIWARKENAQRRKCFRHHAYFSLDRNDRINRNMPFVSQTPEEIYEDKIEQRQLHYAMSCLPEKEAMRIYTYFFSQVSMAEIAKKEGISKAAVTISIKRGLEILKQLIQENNSSTFT